MPILIHIESEINFGHNRSGFVRWNSYTLLSAGSLYLFGYRLLERRVPRLPVREAIFHLFVGIESLFLLLMVNSIFFHPKFGVNITLKESRFGMTLAIIGSAVLVVGAYFQNKKKLKKVKAKGSLSLLLK